MLAMVVCAQNAMSRAGLASMAASPENQVVEAFESLDALDRWLQNGLADLVLLELSTTTNKDVIELARTVEATSSEDAVPFLLLLDSATLEETLADLLQTGLLSSGWVSILPTTISTAELKAAIAATSCGLVVIHPEIAEYLFELSPQFSHSDVDLEALVEPLTPRETEVLNQLANGLTNKAIAQNLHISEHTVKFHISTLFSKLGADSRTEAVTVGIRAGLVAL